MESADFDWDAFDKFVSEFKNESDRAAVVLGAAKLDTVLGQILDRYLLPTVGGADELLEGDAPLSTFSARINICHRLGLITADFAKALHAVRRIRNAFAHELSGCSLDSGPQADRLKSLLLPLKPLPFYEEFRTHFFGKQKGPSVDFKACLAIMVGRLEFRLASTLQVSDDAAYQFIPIDWAEDDSSKAKEPAKVESPSKSEQPTKIESSAPSRAK